MKTISYLLPLCYLFGSCITPIDVDTSTSERILVVEGYITTQPGPHTIRLTKTAKYGTIFQDVVKPETGADVWITDEQGTVTPLIDRDFGLYDTPTGFRGIVGKKYVLHISTGAGVKYASKPELIQQAPSIDSLLYIFRKRPTSDPDDFTLGTEIVATLNDPTEENFYLWKNSGVFKIETFPENYVIPGPFPGVPSPKSCCKTCWVHEKIVDRSISIRSDFNSNGKKITQTVAFIEDNGLRFGERYQITIQQHSISKEAYQFLNLLKSQLSIDGDIFDPPPATIRGNIINLNDPSANVIGYFYASDVAFKSLFIDTNELPETKPTRKINDDCRVLNGSTATKPPGWD